VTTVRMAEGDRSPPSRDDRVCTGDTCVLVGVGLLAPAERPWVRDDSAYVASMVGQATPCLSVGVRTIELMFMGTGRDRIEVSGGAV